MCNRVPTRMDLPFSIGMTAKWCGEGPRVDTEMTVVFDLGDTLAQRVEAGVVSAEYLRALATLCTHHAIVLEQRQAVVAQVRKTKRSKVGGKLIPDSIEPSRA